MPTYNRGYIIARAIESVLSQSYSEWELIVVDDCSDDNTYEIINGYKEDKIKYIKSLERRGACYARNVGMKNASGDYFCFLDSDCIWDRNFLNERLDSATKYNADLIYGRMRYIDGDKVTIWPYDECANLNNSDYVAETLVIRNLIDTNTVMLKKSCWEKEGGFDLEFSRLQDWEYFSRIIHTGKYRLHFQDNALVQNYPQKDSISVINKWGIWRIRVFEKHIDFCRRKGIILDVVLALYFNSDDFMGNDKYRSQLCALLSKNEVTDLVMRMGEIIEDKNGIINNMEYVLKKNVLMKQVLVNWLSGEYGQKKIDTYLNDREIESVAIYGFGVLGRLLYERLKGSLIKVVCIIDKNKERMTDFEECRLISDEEAVKDDLSVDAIIVTAVMDYEEIKRKIELYVNSCEVFSIERIFSELNCRR